MTRRHVLLGSPYEEKLGFARVLVVDEAWAFVTGCTGADPETGAVAEEAGAQARAALANVEAALGAAGFALGDIVRARIYLAERADFEAVAAAVGERLAAVRPANTTVIAPLVDPRWKVEIEVTAFRRGGPGRAGPA